MSTASSSAKRKRSNQSDSLLMLLECPICVEQMLPPIFQCTNGHVICSACKPKISNCPNCQVADLSVRNLQIERMAESIEQPCRYQEYGCDETLPYLTESEHANDCRFRPLRCPEPNCQWTCKTSQALASHLEDSHRHVYINPNALTNPEGLPLPLSWNFLMKHGNRCYKLRVELVEAGCWAYVLELENPGRTVPTKYRLSLSGNQRAFSFEGFAYSYDAPSKPPENEDCLFVRSHMMAHASSAKNSADPVERKKFELNYTCEQQLYL